MVQDPDLREEGKIQSAAEDKPPQESSPSTRTAHRCTPSALRRRENMQMARAFSPFPPENAQDRTAPARETTADLDGSHRKTHIRHCLWEFHSLPAQFAPWLLWQIFLSRVGRAGVSP